MAVQTNVATSILVPSPRHPVRAPSPCDISAGMSLSTFEIHIGSVKGVRSSLLGRSCDVLCENRMLVTGTFEAYSFDTLIRSLPSTRLAYDEGR